VTLPSTVIWPFSGPYYFAVYSVYGIFMNFDWNFVRDCDYQPLEKTGQHCPTWRCSLSTFYFFVVVNLEVFWQCFGRRLEESRERFSSVLVVVWKICGCFGHTIPPSPPPRKAHTHIHKAENSGFGRLKGKTQIYINKKRMGGFRLMTKQQKITIKRLTTISIWVYLFLPASAPGDSWWRTVLLISLLHGTCH